MATENPPNDPYTPYAPPAELADTSTAALRQIVQADNPMLRCRRLDPDLWSRHSTAAAARQLCAGCPIRAECAELALRDEMRAGLAHINGVRGGMSPRERRQVIRVRVAQSRKAS